ncbi:hypothetical protein [Dokdonella soli]|uniref:Uncharacterized protein n=1 Tax=Dokdonella soli TaxID=529810 RepID=A0ABN1ILF1_9GAMM
MRVSLRAAWFAAALVIADARPVAAATIEIYPYLGEGDSADLTVLVGGESRCSIKIANAARDISKTPVCKFELPASATSLTVRRGYGDVHSATQKRQPRKGEQSWRIVDFGVAGSRLAQSGKPYGERMVDFIAAADAFGAKQFGADHGRSIAIGKPVGHAEVEAAEKRLGYALPVDFVSMQEKVGAIAIGDHSLTAIGDVADAYTQMRKVWGTPEDAMQSDYSESMQKTLKASTLLFTEVGDGYGGLFYRPPPSKRCGDKGFYYWTSQEGGSASLMNEDGSCMDFAAAFRWVLEGFLLEGYADELSSEKRALLVDSSNPVQPLVLRTNSNRFGIELGVRWQGPNGFWRSPDTR